MFGILAKFFRFSGKENGNKFKLSIVIGLIEAFASAMKIPAIMYILIGLLSGKSTGKSGGYRWTGHRGNKEKWML